MWRFLLIFLAFLSASDLARAETAREARLDFCGFFLRYSPGGVRFFAVFEFANRSAQKMEFVGTKEADRLYVDPNWEATKQSRAPNDDAWKVGTSSLEERSNPTGRLTVLPGEMEKLYVQWNEADFIVTPEGTRFRYVIRDVTGKEHLTSEFRIRDKSESISSAAFATDLPPRP